MNPSLIPAYLLAWQVKHVLILVMSGFKPLKQLTRKAFQGTLIFTSALRNHSLRINPGGWVTEGVCDRSSTVASLRYFNNSIINPICIQRATQNVTYIVLFRKVSSKTYHSSTYHRFMSLFFISTVCANVQDMVRKQFGLSWRFILLLLFSSLSSHPPDFSSSLLYFGLESHPSHNKWERFLEGLLVLGRFFRFNPRLLEIKKENCPDRSNRLSNPWGFDRRTVGTLESTSASTDPV